MTPSRIHIIGKGAIGLLLSYYLANKSNNLVTLCQRKKREEFTFSYQKLNLIEKINLTFDNVHEDKISFLIIPTKSYDVVTAFLSIKARLTDNAVIILCHNGMGTIEKIEPLLSQKQSLFFLTTTMGAFKKNNNLLIHTGSGPSSLGAINQSAIKHKISVFKFLANSIPHMSLSENIQQLLWRKLMINIAINPLSAIFNVKNGALNQPQFALKIFQLLYEAYLVANKEGVKLSFPEILNSAYTVMAATDQNYSSMNRDLNLGNKTEISAISGYIVNLAKQHNIEAPHNKDVYSILSAQYKK